MSSLALLILIIAVVAVVLIGVVVGVRWSAAAGLRRCRARTPTSLVQPPEAAADTEAPPVEPSAPPGHDREAGADRVAGWSGCASGWPVPRAALGRGLLALLSRDRLDEDTWESIEDPLLTADLGVGPDPAGRRRAARPGSGSRATPEDAEDRAPRGADHARRPRPWTAASRSAAPTASRASCSWSASTAPARPPPSASSPGSWSPRTAPSSSARPTPSGPPPSTSWPPGASGSASRWSAAPRAPTRPASPSTRSSTVSTRASTPSSSTPPAGCRTRPDLMDELGKVKRVIEKQAPVTEVLLVLDATTGQNGLHPGPGLLRGRRRHRRRAHQARRLGQGRHRRRRSSASSAYRSSWSASARAPTTSRRSTPTAFVDALLG